ncbi:MAG TPA: thioesterase family protein [Thermoanaerobaculia bacterium]|nr:thioesterase family protein [Thermoanaerobaculia bacterium]
MTAPQEDLPATPGRYRVGEFVRWSDIDLAGIICYGAYVRFFEIAESELFRSIGFPFSQLFERFDFWLPRAALHFEFRSPALLDDRLDVEMWVSQVGNSSLRLQFEVRKQGPERVMTAEGYAVLVAVARGDLRPIPLPPEFVAALGPYRGGDQGLQGQQGLQ